MNYNIFIPKNANISAMRIWTIQSVVALAFAGILAFILGTARTPYVQSFFPFRDIFHISLVIHVDLSVLVWLLSVLATLITGSVAKSLNGFSKSSAILAVIGSTLIFFSAFYPEGEPLMNNYIPVLTNIIFITGLSIFLSAILIQSILLLISPILIKDSKFLFKNPLYNLIYSSAFIYLLVIASFMISKLKINSLLETTNLSQFEFYEFIFWAMGHVMQYVYIQLLIYAWLVLSSYVNLFSKINNWLLNVIIWSNAIFAALTFFGLFQYEINSQEFIEFYTNNMIYFGGIAISLISILLAIGFAKNYKNLYNLQTPIASCLFSSFILFCYGGFLGYMIVGSNTVIPAHYHGSIIGISIAAMGIVYLILPKLGFGQIKYRKLAVSQAYIYAFGQILHITGLAISGGYGELRKTPGEPLTADAKFYMGIMGAGNAISVIGGLIFVILALISIMNYKERRIVNKVNFRKYKSGKRYSKTNKTRS